MSIDDPKARIAARVPPADPICSMHRLDEAAGLGVPILRQEILGLIARNVRTVGLDGDCLFQLPNHHGVMLRNGTWTITKHRTHQLVADGTGLASLVGRLFGLSDADAAVCLFMMATGETLDGPARADIAAALTAYAARRTEAR